MASQSQSQDSTIEDQRFAELLKPIKDLTQNWEVPLAEIMSEYMDVLQQVTITFDGGQTSVNFAQAALVLQGTASVYSKKVDFLWQMVLKTTELLRNKEDNENAADGEDGAGGASGRGKKKMVDMTKEFELLTIDIAKNIDLRMDDEETVNERKNALNFIYVTPRQLIEKEGSEQKSVKVNLYMGVANAKWDLLAAKEDFRINGQYVSQTGYLGEELNVDNQYLNLVTEETMEEDPNHVSFIPDVEPAQDGIEEAPLLDHSLVAANDDIDNGEGDVSVMSERAVGQNMSNVERDVLASPPPPPSPKAPPTPVFDPWEPLDPHAQLSTPKPIKVKKTLRIPPSLKKKDNLNEDLIPISQYINEEMLQDNTHHHRMFPDVPLCFSDFMEKEYHRRKERARLERLEERKSQQLRQAFYETDEEQDDFFGVDGHDVDDVQDQVDEDVPEDIIDDLDLLNPHMGGDLGAVAAGELDDDDFNAGGDLDNADSDETLSYEEMVARKVEQFVTKSQEYMRSSELAMKVAKWHEMIGPRLESVERRNAFDIHAYGSRILNNFSPQRSSVSFNSVVRGQKPEEKSRYFLSMLMLANTENVEISTADGSDPQLGMDNVMIKLLSTSRHHQQLEEFQAASSQGGADTSDNQENVLVEVSASQERRSSGSPPMKKPSKKRKK